MNTLGLYTDFSDISEKYATFPDFPRQPDMHLSSHLYLPGMSRWKPCIKLKA